MTDLEKILFGLGLLGVGVLLLLPRKALSDVGRAALDSANDSIFTASLPSSARSYSAVIRQVALSTSVDPFIIAALGQRESQWGALLSPRGPAGTGDAGHGRGLMQIDDRTWGPDADGNVSGNGWLAANDWTDPVVNITKGAQIFADYLAQAQNAGLSGDAAIQAAMGAYNRGPGAITNAAAGGSPDEGTTGGDYASSVWGSFQALAGSFASSAGLA